MTGNALNVTGVRCGGLMSRKVPRLCPSTVLVGLAQAEGSGQGGCRLQRRGAGESLRGQQCDDMMMRPPLHRTVQRDFSIPTHNLNYI